MVAALPLLALLLLGGRAKRVMPGVREWIDTHSWVISIAACLVFVVLILV